MRPRLAQLHQSGATDGQLAAWDNALGYWVPIDAPSTTPTGAAGGVLSGTYPNPGFAVDMATQAELDAVAAAAVTTASDLTTVVVPTVVTVAGTPELLFDADDNLVLMEVAYP